MVVTDGCERGGCEVCGGRGVRDARDGAKSIQE